MDIGKKREILGKTLKKAGSKIGKAAKEVKRTYRLTKIGLRPEHRSQFLKGAAKFNLNRAARAAKISSNKAVVLKDTVKNFVKKNVSKGKEAVGKARDTAMQARKTKSWDKLAKAKSESWSKLSSGKGKAWNKINKLEAAKGKQFGKMTEASARHFNKLSKIDTKHWKNLKSAEYTRNIGTAGTLGRLGVLGAVTTAAASPALYGASKYKKDLGKETKSHEVVGKLADRRRAQVVADRKMKGIKVIGRGWGEPGGKK